LFLQKEYNYFEIKKKGRSSHPFFSFYSKCYEKNTHKGYHTPPLPLVLTITTKKTLGRHRTPLFFLLQPLPQNLNIRGASRPPSSS
jgi:hypothetical protein